MLFAPNPVFVFAVFPNPPVLPPNPPVVPVFDPNKPPPVVAVADAPKAGLLAPNGLFACWLLLLLVAPKPPNAPVVAVLPPKSEPPEVVAALLFVPNPLVFVFDTPKPKPVEPVLLLLLLPKPNDMAAIARG